jgi:hypothetical protein
MAEAKPSFEEELRTILSAITIISPSSFTLAGQMMPVNELMAPAASSMAQNPAIVTQLQDCLYQYCYCRRFQPGFMNQLPTDPVAADSSFLAQLSQANRSNSRWDMGWVVRRSEPTGQIWAEKGGVNRMFSPGEFVNYNGPGSPVNTGTVVGAYIAKESTTVQPGCYFAFGETISSSGYFDIVRFYWNIDSAGIGQLVQIVTRDLNRFQVPFQFKCPVYPQAYFRRDAAVLYVNKRYYFLVRELVTAWLQECEKCLQDDVPLFTLPLDKGIGLAEDPATGESFGINRCRHVAEAIWKAHSKEVPQSERLPAVVQHFREHGLDFQRPYLNAGSIDQYNSRAAA